MEQALKPCPFCGGEAERIDIDDGDNAGGSFIHCTVCDASGNVEFEFKENFVSNWNRRTPTAIKSSPVVGEIEAVDAHKIARGIADQQWLDTCSKRALASAIERAITASLTSLQSENQALREEVERLARLTDGLDEERRGALDLCIQRNKQIAAAESQAQSLTLKLEERDKALEPFAREADQWEGYDDTEGLVEGWGTGPASSITVGDLRRARALQSGGAEHA